MHDTNPLVERNRVDMTWLVRFTTNEAIVRSVAGNISLGSSIGYDGIQKPSAHCMRRSCLFHVWSLLLRLGGLLLDMACMKSNKTTAVAKEEWQLQQLGLLKA